ncbi:MAG: hypothetical protein GVY28_02305, partial [Alphaproteobacteria bacterium]|nr:hypothetical protein [Alphaproteobacteria bacterium]
VAFLLAGLAILVAVAAWRLQAGPIEVDALTPILESQMADGPVRLEIDRTLLRWEGFDRPLALAATGVRLTGPEGVLIAAIPELEVGVSVPALARRQIEPRRLTLVRPTLRMVREADGSLSLAVGEADAIAPGTDGPDILATLVAAIEAPTGDAAQPMAALTQVVVEDGRLIVDDRALDQLWLAPDADIVLSRRPDGIDGRLDLLLDVRGRRVALGADAVWRAGDPTAEGLAAQPSLAVDAAIGLRLDGLPARLAAAATVRPGAPATSITVDFENVTPAALADLDPVLAPLQAIASPMRGNALVAVDRDFRPTFVDFAFRGAQGMIDVPGLYAEPLTIAGLEAEGGADLDGGRFVVERLAVDLGGPRLTARMEANQRGDRLVMAAEGQVTALPVDLLDTYWPPDVGGGARGWVTRNVNRGLVDRAEVFLDLEAPVDDLEAIEVVALDGGIDFADATLTVIGGLPPITGIAGHARFDDAVFWIDTVGGSLAGLAVPEASIAITGLDTAAADDAIDIETVVRGPVRDALAVLDAPPLGFMAEMGIDPAVTAGAMSARLRFAFPLIEALAFEDVAVSAAANLRDAAIGEIAPGLAVGGVDAALSLDGQGMTVDGTGALNGVPLSFTWTERFAEAGSTRIDYAATLDAAGRAALNLPEPDWLDGPVAVRGRLTPSPGGEVLTVRGDLTPATMTLAPLGWSKPAGQPAELSVTAILGAGGVDRLEDLVLTAPGLEIAGRARFAGGDRLAAAIIERLALGETRLSGTVERDAEGWRILADGPRLDLRPVLDGTVDPVGGDGDDTAGPAFAVDLSLGEVILGPDRRLVGVDGSVVHDGRDWQRVDLTGQAGSGGRIAVALLPTGDGGASLSVDAADAGAALTALDLADGRRGGSLAIRGRRPPGGAFLGT